MAPCLVACVGALPWPAQDTTPPAEPWPGPQATRTLMWNQITVHSWTFEQEGRGLLAASDSTHCLFRLHRRPSLCNLALCPDCFRYSDFICITFGLPEPRGSEKFFLKVLFSTPPAQGKNNPFESHFCTGQWQLRTLRPRRRFGAGGAECGGLLGWGHRQEESGRCRFLERNHVHSCANVYNNH